MKRFAMLYVDSTAVLFQADTQCGVGKPGWTDINNYDDSIRPFWYTESAMIMKKAQILHHYIRFVDEKEFEILRVFNV